MLKFLGQILQFSEEIRQPVVVGFLCVLNLHCLYGAVGG
jgi:hypothetical protein